MGRLEGPTWHVKAIKRGKGLNFSRGGNFGQEVKKNACPQNAGRDLCFGVQRRRNEKSPCIRNTVSKKKANNV